MAYLGDYSQMKKEIEAAAYFDRVVGKYFSSMIGSNTDTVIFRLRSCFDSMSMTYRRGLRNAGSRPDWSTDDNRCTYIYRFFTMHCHLVYHSLQLSCDELKSLWKKHLTLRVCCIGGGPGSDVVGLTKFLRDKELFPVDRLECSIIDIYKDWEKNWGTLNKANPCELPRMSYLSGNITRTDSGLSIGELATFRSADVITMVKFFSTVAAFIRKDDAHGNLLKKIFQEMKPGAVVLYIDNRYGNQHEEFKTLAALGGMTETLFEWHGMISLPCVVHSESVQLIKQATGFEPLHQCTVSIVLLRKPLQTEGTEGSPVTYGSTLAVTHKIGFGWGQRRPWHQTLFPKPSHRYRLRLGRRNKDDNAHTEAKTGNICSKVEPGGKKTLLRWSERVRSKPKWMSDYVMY